MLVDRAIGGEREVDVVIQGNFGGHDVLVSVECQASSRKATVEWVERMAMKHSTLPTSKLVLVAQNGFTGTATRKAEHLGVSTFSLEEALALEWKDVLGESLACEVFVIRIVKCELVLADPRAPKLYPPRKFGIFYADGTSRCSLGELIDEATSKSPEPFLDQAVKFSIENHLSLVGAHVVVKPPPYAKNMSNELHCITQIALYIEVHPTKLSTPFSAARYRKNPVAYAEGTSPAGQFAVTLVKPSTGGPSGALTITPPGIDKPITVPVTLSSGGSKVSFFSGIVTTNRNAT